MSITAITSSTEVPTLLRSSGLGSYEARLIETETEELQQQVSGVSTNTFDSAALRSALSAQIDDDVAAGVLSEQDASKVRQSLGLEETEESASETPEEAAGIVTASASQAAGTGAAAGGGASGESEANEISRTETIAGGVKTTIILYDDGSTETQISYTTASDNPTPPDASVTVGLLPAPAQDVASAYGHEDAESYLMTIAHGSYMDLRA